MYSGEMSTFSVAFGKKLVRVMGPISGALDRAVRLLYALRRTSITMSSRKTTTTPAATVSYFRWP